MGGREHQAGTGIPAFTPAWLQTNMGTLAQLLNCSVFILSFENQVDLLKSVVFMFFKAVNTGEMGYPCPGGRDEVLDSFDSWT